MQLIKQLGKQLSFVVLIGSAMFSASSASAVERTILVNTDLIIDAAELQKRFPGVNELDLVTIGGTHYSDPDGKNGVFNFEGETLYDPFNHVYTKGNNLIVGGSSFTSNVQSDGRPIPGFTITGQFNEAQSSSKPKGGILTFGLSSSAANPPALSSGDITNYGSCIFQKCVVFHYGYKIKNIETHQGINPYFKGSFYRVRNMKSTSDLFRTYEMMSPEVALNSPEQENAPTEFLVVYSQQINPKRPNAVIVNWTEFPVKRGQTPTFRFTNSESNFDPITVSNPRYLRSATQIPLEKLNAADLPPTDLLGFVDINIPGANANGIITVAPGGTTTPVLLPPTPVPPVPPVPVNPTGVTFINGAGASTINTLFVGTGTNFPFAPKGSWFNAYGIGNPPSLNNDVPPQPVPASTPPFPNGGYGPVNPAVTFRYASVGSGAGITAFFTQTPPPITATNSATINPPVSFGVSDDPVSLRNVTGSPNDVPTPPFPVGGFQNPPAYVQIPVVGVGIALSYNRTGLNNIPTTGLRLSRASYCGILNGSITNWNSPSIRADNGGVILTTNLPIRVVRRSDGSGSTAALSGHLNAACKIPGAAGVPAGGGTPGLPASAVWNRGVGTNSVAGTVPPAPPANTVVWPASFLSASGGGGVATAIATNFGAIGYVDSATRLARNLPAVVLRNKANNFTAISSTSISAAFAGATDADPNARRISLVVNDPTAATAYPIVTATYMLFYDKYANVNVANGIKGFINWALAVPPTPAPAPSINPNNIATLRGYAPLPDSIKTLSRNLVNLCVDTAFDPLVCTNPPQ